MATITQQKVINGLIADEAMLSREIPSGVSKIDGNKMLLAQVCVEAFTNTNGATDDEFLAKVTALFQEQFTKLKAINDLFAKIEACGANDPVTGEPDLPARAAALTDLMTTYGIDPTTFANRYK